VSGDRQRDLSKSQLTFVVSDMHFDLHHPAAWEAFVRCVREEKPHRIVFNGDVFDFGQLSRYRQDAGDPLRAVEQIKCFLQELKRISPHVKELVFVEGNHDERWSKIVSSVPGEALAGAIGLSLREQCLAQGMPKSVIWIRESTKCRGFYVGPFLLRHAHKQAGRFGGAIHIAANRLAKNNGQSEINGHHHRAQMFCRTAGGKTAVSIANGCMTIAHEYAPDADWQLSFTVIEEFGSNKATAFPVVMEPEGSFAFRGKAYDGPYLLKRRHR